MILVTCWLRLPSSDQGLVDSTLATNPRLHSALGNKAGPTSPSQPGLKKRSHPPRTEAYVATWQEAAESLLERKLPAEVVGNTWEGRIRLWFGLPSVA